MHAIEEATILAFIVVSARDRWLQKLSSARHRRQFLDRLNHCPDIDARYATPLASTANVAEVLRSRGAPAMCYVVSDVAAMDGRELPLAQAIDDTETAGWGTLICCIPGQLAYYSDELGARRLILERAV